MRKRSLIIVEWDDAFATNKWHDEADITEVTPMRCTTVGWRMPAKRGYFSMASTRDTQGKCTDRMTIPRGNVNSIRRLVVEDKE